MNASLGTIERCWSGPERASAETAEALGVATTAQSALQSWSMGVWAGRPVSDVVENQPLEFGSWRTDPDATPHESESLNDLLGRVGRWMEDRQETDRRALVIADPTVIRAAIVHALGAEAAVFWRFDVRPLSVTVVGSANGAWRVRTVGSELAR